MSGERRLFVFRLDHNKRDWSFEQSAIFPHLVARIACTTFEQSGVVLLRLIRISLFEEGLERKLRYQNLGLVNTKYNPPAIKIVTGSVMSHAITMREIIPYLSPAPDVTIVPAMPDVTM